MSKKKGMSTRKTQTKKAVSMLAQTRDAKNFEFQVRHPVFTRGAWKPMDFEKMKKKSFFGKFVDFLQESKIISSSADAIGAATGNPIAGQIIGDVAGSLGFNSRNLVVKRPVMYATTPTTRPAVRRKRTKK